MSVIVNDYRQSATYGGEFLHTDALEMAAAYLFHWVKNHPFLDGNKRVGTVAALEPAAVAGAPARPA